MEQEIAANKIALFKGTKIRRTIYSHPDCHSRENGNPEFEDKLGHSIVSK